MIRTLPLAALLAGVLSAHALADDTSTIAAATAQLNVAANAQQARQLLVAQGYTNVSLLDRNEQGRWVGVASKDGKMVGVSIALPSRDSGKF